MSNEGSDRTSSPLLSSARERLRSQDSGQKEDGGEKTPRRLPSPSKTRSTQPVVSIKLTAEQEAACAIRPGKTAIIATAGSGKTTTMSFKIRNLLARSDVSDRDVLATTFTKAAAADLKSRIDGFVGRKTNVITGTLHAFCAGLVLENWRDVGFKNPPVILSEREKADTLTRLMLRVANVGKKEDIKTFSSLDVDRWLVELDVRTYSDDPRDRDPFTVAAPPKAAVLEICKLYKQKCKEFGFLDFDGILTTALELLTKNDQHNLGLKLPKYVFVDEAQDLSAIQWFIVEALAGKASTIDVIGDDDQSIYAWRRALPWRFIKYVEDADSKHYLTSNRRCARGIVRLAAQVIEEIPASRRVAKDLSAVRDAPGSVRFTVMPEIRSLWLCVKKIRTEVGESEKTYKDFAFIARSTTRIFPEIESCLKRAQLPYKILGGVKSSFERPEMALLRSLGNLVLHRQGSESPLLWESLLSDIGVSPAAAAKILDAAIQMDGTIKSFEWAIHESRIGPSSKESLARLTPVVTSLRLRERVLFSDLLDQQEISSLTSLLIHRGVQGDLKRQQKKGTLNPVDRDARSSDLIARRRDDLSSINSQFANMGLEQAMISLNLDSRDEEKSADCVVLTTVHSSKGLEFDTVFVAEVNDKNWPSAMAGRGLKNLPVEHFQNVMDEERRLLYVAITRAKNNLYLLTTLKDVHSSAPQSPSRFFPKWLHEAVVKVFDVVAESIKEGRRMSHGKSLDLERCKIEE